MKDKKMDPVELRVKFSGENIEDYLNSFDSPRSSLSKAVFNLIYYSANTHNHTFKVTGYQERIITVVLPVTSEVLEAADGFSLKHHMIHACKDVVRNKEFYHG